MPHATRSAAQPLMPGWFRVSLIVVAALLMCSCKAQGQEAGPQQASYEGCGSQSCEPSCGPCGPVVGPSDEYLCDGDDHQLPAAVTRDGDYVGLEQEDTIGHYTAPDGSVVTVPSTRTCIYAPRFGAVRRVMHPMAAERRLFVGQVGDSFTPAQAADLGVPTTTLQNLALQERAAELPPSLYRGRMQAGATERLRKAAETLGLVAPYANLSLVHLGRIDGSEEPVIAEHALAAITWTGDQEVQVTISGQGASALFDAKHPGMLFQTNEPNCPRLRIVKLASTDAAHPGDEIEFTLRVDNIGDAPMRDVVIVDNLTTRLAYVEGSADATLDAEFSTARNEAGSLVLRWALTEPLEAGDGGVLTFKVRVR